MKIHKDDNVIVLSGKDKGKRGQVMRALPKTDKVVIEGVHRVKRSQRTTQIRKTGWDNRKGPPGARLDRGVDLPQGAHAHAHRVQVLGRRHASAGFAFVAVRASDVAGR